MTVDQYNVQAAVEDTHWWFVARRRILVTLASELLGRAPSKRIVDVGCSTGANTAALANLYNCIGVDPSVAAIERARSRFPHVQFVAAYAPHEVRPELRRADLVVLADVIEHIADDQQFVSELASTITRGTYVLITVPADRTLWSPHDTAHGHFRRYTASSLRALLNDAPLSVQLLSYFNSLLYPPILIARTLSRWIGNAWGPAGTDLAVPPKHLNDLLYTLFASEAGGLCRAFRRGTARRVPFGVSALAVCQRS
jgi:SAM-dependent methyltransferase